MNDSGNEDSDEQSNFELVPCENDATTSSKASTSSLLTSYYKLLNTNNNNNNNNANSNTNNNDQNNDDDDEENRPTMSSKLFKRDLDAASSSPSSPSRPSTSGNTYNNRYSRRQMNNLAARNARQNYRNNLTSARRFLNNNNNNSLNFTNVNISVGKVNNRQDPLKEQIRALSTFDEINKTKIGSNIINVLPTEGINRKNISNLKNLTSILL